MRHLRRLTPIETGGRPYPAGETPQTGVSLVSDFNAAGSSASPENRVARFAACPSARRRWATAELDWGVKLPVRVLELALGSTGRMPLRLGQGPGWMSSALRIPGLLLAPGGPTLLQLRDDGSGIRAG